jgi:hypothetical protein
MRASARRRWSGVAIGLALVLRAGALDAAPDTTTRPGAAVDTGPPAHSVRDSPGWYPNVDPESTSVVVGRRTNAPRVSQRFQGGARSLEDLGRRVCRALHHERADSLLALCITEEEFRTILWRELPQSRPATGLTWQDAWSTLSMRLYSGTRGATQDHGGHYYEFLHFERSDTTARYRNFKLHNGLILVARDDQGQIERFDWLRSVAERNGAFKIYSVRD